MSLLGTLGSWLFGGGGNAVVNVAKGVDDIVDRHVATVQDKAAFTKDVAGLIEQSQASARGYAAPGVHNTAFDALVDGINRLIRPFLAVGLIGGCWHWWPMPDIGNLSPQMQQLVFGVWGFYFGARFLTKDVPEAVVGLMGVLNKKGNT